MTRRINHTSSARSGITTNLEHRSKGGVMASAKEAVQTFMELGAKYEVVLVGLSDEVTKQGQAVKTAAENAARSSESAANAVMQLETIRSEAAKALTSIKELLAKVDATHAEAESTLQTLEERLRGLDAADLRQHHETERLARTSQRNFILLGVSAVASMLIGIIALVG